MELADSRSLSHVLERDVDLVVVQLLQTDTSFPRWFVRQLEPDLDVDRIVGVKHSVTDAKGESDIVFGIETADEQRHLCLIENKIDAAKQERQAGRYLERGRGYVTDGAWDDFHVVLIAPDRYIGELERTEFQTVIRYEAIAAQVSGLHHDGSPFIREVLETALERHIGTDHSGLMSAIQQRLIRSDQLPDLEQPEQTPTQVRLYSHHPDHPRHVFYKVYAPGSKDGNRTVVRLQLRSDTSDAEEQRIRSMLAASIDELGGFQYEPDRIMNTVWTDIRRSDPAIENREAYIEEIVSAVHDLLGFYHPRLVEL